MVDNNVFAVVRKENDINDSDPFGLDSYVPNSDENESDSDCDEMSTTVIHDEDTQFSTISDISKSECRGMSESNGRKRKHRGDGGDQASKKRRISVHWSDMDNKKITSFFKDWIVGSLPGKQTIIDFINSNGNLESIKELTLEEKYWK